MKLTALIFLLLAASVPAQSPNPEPLGVALENVAYPHPVCFFPVTVEGRDLRIAYMDVTPSGTVNGQTVLLLHGKNFFGAYWAGTIQALSAAGFRVVVPDQLGFGKSAKPDIHYSLELLAQTTKALLDSLGGTKATVVGHSMGGMLAVRYALLYPTATARLVLENPIGLEDYRVKVPFTSVDATYRTMLTPTREGLDRFYRSYFGTWKPEFGLLSEQAWRATLSGE